MFQEVICNEVVKYLREAFPLRDDQCYASLDEKPFPDRGDLSLVVYPGDALPGPSDDQQIDAAEMMTSFFVGVTRSIGQIPRDRWFKYAYTPIKGLIPIARRTFGILRRDRLILQQRINNGFSELESETFNWKLVEPFLFQGFTANPTQVGPEHFNRDPRAPQDAPHGIWLPLEFGEGRVMGKISETGYDFGYDLGFEA